MFEVIHYIEAGFNTSVCGRGKSYNDNCSIDPAQTTCKSCLKNKLFLIAAAKPIEPILDWIHHQAPEEGWYWVITTCNVKSVAYSNGKLWLTNDYENEDWETFSQVIEWYIYIDEPRSP